MTPRRRSRTDAGFAKLCQNAEKIIRDLSRYLHFYLKLPFTCIQTLGNLPFTCPVAMHWLNSLG
jgi:hypothetical protein